MKKVTENENAIYGIGKNGEKNIIQKSLPLLELYKSEITLPEFKILDMYLSRIDSRNNMADEVVFTKEELERVLNVSKINLKDLKERLKHLQGTVVELPSLEDSEDFHNITLFQSSKSMLNEHGERIICLKCTQDAKKYIFNIDNIGYLKYKLKSVINLRRRYSYILFMFLENNRFRKEWVISLEDLKKLLNCKDQLYDEFKFFNNKILKVSKKEIEEKTDCRFDYTPLRTGRKVDRIKFVIESRNRFIAIDEKMIVELPDKYNKPFYLWVRAVEELKLNLTPEQIEEMDAILLTIPESKLPEMEDLAFADIDIRRYHYMVRIVREIIRRDSEKKIKNKYNYLVKILKKDSGA